MTCDADHSTGPLKRKIVAGSRMPVARARGRGLGSRLKREAVRGQALEATIVAALDRDSKLRHDYLRRRWQGTTR